MVELVRIDGWREYIVGVEEPRWVEIDKHRKERLYFAYYITKTGDEMEWHIATENMLKTLTMLVEKDLVISMEYFYITPANFTEIQKKFFDDNWGYLQTLV